MADYLDIRTPEVLAETHLAYLCKWQNSENSLEAWLPKSQVRISGKTWTVPKWLTDEKGIPLKANGAFTDFTLESQLTLESPVAVSLEGNMPQQTAAIEHLHDKRVFALFMECRAGKTKTAIDLVTSHYKAGHIDRCLWIMPLSVKRTAEWQWSVFKQAELPVMFFASETLSGCGAARLQPLLDFVDGGKCALIVDESHMFKNGLTKRFKRLNDIASKFPVRGILSGSPITQNISDIYAQARLLDWRILGYKNYSHFQRNHLIMSDKYPGMVRDTKNVERITKRMAPYTFDYFPPPSNTDTERVLYCDLSTMQHNAYQSIKKTILDRLTQDEQFTYDIYLMFTALQSVMSGYLSVQLQKQIYHRDTKPEDMPELEPWIYTSPKLFLLHETRANIDSSVVIWCSRKHEIESIARELPDVITISGDDTPDERHEKIKAFRESTAGTLAAMLPVAKRGIDMYECDVAIFYGQSFDYESRVQAAARIKAPAVKTRPCAYYDLIYENTLDERILRSHGKKESIVSHFVRLLKADKQRALKELEAV